MVPNGQVFVKRVESAAERRTFIELPFRAYRHLPAWRAPLRFERAAQIDPKRNPALAQMPHELLLAYRENEPVGRIAVFINPAHLARHNDQTGHFGFLDTLKEDDEAVSVLMQAAESWLRWKGMLKIAGPFNFSVNEECGLLVDGFDTPPVMMMLHGRPDYAPALERGGYSKMMDMYAYMIRMGDTFEPPPIASRLIEGFNRDPNLRIRNMDSQNYGQEITQILDIFDDAWSDNWGFVPFGKAEITHMAKELKPLINPDHLWIGMIDEEPACFALVLPDIFEAAEGLDGRLLPFGWVQFLHRLKISGTKTARIPLAGMRRKFHKTRRGVQTMAATCSQAVSAQHARGVRNIEASWILETNTNLINIISLFDAPRYKTYRIYGKSL
ncbi:conserved hypothetical protein [Hyphomonas neptunium ATCC 15444]|uniref:N-acetyltransferase domain-containing protein n=1 Tax=Hyphomonas neptunium (strain ATCC 15444) TaxID=228405 RepID=Q0C1U9_HYPNA|nr:conserved hypothetical protein [Hyphomonas neptunium ATCC 15444]